MPFVVLTANATTDVKMECEEVGVNAYLTKPIAPTLLLNTLDQLVTSHNENRNEAVDSGHSRGGSVLDTDVLDNLAELCGEEHIREKLVPIFSHDVSAELETLTTSLKSREYESFRNCAHALKGTAATLGAAQLAQLAETAMSADAETIIRDGADMLEQIEIAFEEARKQLQSFGAAREITVTEPFQAID